MRLRYSLSVHSERWRQLLRFYVSATIRAGLPNRWRLLSCVRGGHVWQNVLINRFHFRLLAHNFSTSGAVPAALLRPGYGLCYSSCPYILRSSCWLSSTTRRCALSKRVRLDRYTRSTVPTGPLRCLAIFRWDIFCIAGSSSR